MKAVIALLVFGGSLVASAAIAADVKDVLRDRWSGCGQFTIHDRDPCSEMPPMRDCCAFGWRVQDCRPYDWLTIVR
ncbi:MAG TPA: hypothetical protein VGP86_07360 [Xanthobacteraceae bacterium]|jgi:hypothetical protein|nr:hypothetical protein [Xanthobacteraceae bacterium]